MRCVSCCMCVLHFNVHSVNRGTQVAIRAIVDTYIPQLRYFKVMRTDSNQDRSMFHSRRHGLFDSHCYYLCCVYTEKFMILDVFCLKNET